MKKFGCIALSVLIGAASCAAMAGCGKSYDGEVNVYNWGEYIANGEDGNLDVIEEFGIMPKYRSGFFTYNVIKEYFLRGDKTTKFMILNEKKEWLNCIEYMLNKNNDICKIVEKKEEIFHHSKDIKYKFTSFLVEHV